MAKSKVFWTTKMRIFKVWLMILNPLQHSVSVTLKAKKISFKCSTYCKSDLYQWKKPCTSTSQQFTVWENKKKISERVIFWNVFLAYFPQILPFLSELFTPYTHAHLPHALFILELSMTNRENPKDCFWQNCSNKTDSKYLTFPDNQHHRKWQCWHSVT